MSHNGVIETDLLGPGSFFDKASEMLYLQQLLKIKMDPVFDPARVAVGEATYDAKRTEPCGE